MIADKKAMLEAWEKGWACLLNAVERLKPEDLSKIIYIRTRAKSRAGRIQRQLAIILIMWSDPVSKPRPSRKWFKSLFIPKGASSDFNKTKFSEEKQKALLLTSCNLEIQVGA